MSKNRLFSLFLVGILISLVLPSASFAGPGGIIAKVVAKTFWGKLFFGLTILFFLPLILYTVIREKLAKRRALKDLRYVARFDPSFDWFRIRERILDCFHRIHQAWREEDVTAASEFMTPWYWQNQQRIYLDEWAKDGLYNECRIKRILSVNPLLFIHRNNGGGEHEGSLLVISITARMRDYLVRRATGEIVEGDTEFKDNETVWSFSFSNGQWRVSNIEEASFSLEYASHTRHLPNIKDTIINRAGN